MKLPVRTCPIALKLSIRTCTIHIIAVNGAIIHVGHTTNERVAQKRGHPPLPEEVISMILRGQIPGRQIRMILPLLKNGHLLPLPRDFPSIILRRYDHASTKTNYHDATNTHQVQNVILRGQNTKYHDSIVYTRTKRYEVSFDGHTWENYDDSIISSEKKWSQFYERTKTRPMACVRNNDPMVTAGVIFSWSMWA